MSNLFQIPNSELYFGSNQGFKNLENKQEFAIVHFCKSSFEKYSNNDKKINIQKNIYELNNELFVNIIDEKDPNYFEFEMFVNVINWLNKREKVFIHCDYGQSRSPSFCMLYGSKILRILPNDFLECVRIMKKIQPDFVTPSGITKFLKQNWKQFND
jgi:protein-tyrosine phosphatase